MIKKYDTLDTTIYVTSASTKLYCTICGSPSHQHNDCRSPIARQRFPKKVFIKRNLSNNDQEGLEDQIPITKPLYNNSNTSPIDFNGAAPSTHRSNPYKVVKPTAPKKNNNNDNSNNHTNKDKGKNNELAPNNQNNDAETSTAFDRIEQLIGENRNLNNNILNIFESITSIKKELSSHRTILEQQQKIINNHTETFVAHTDILKELYNKMDSLSTDLSDIKNKSTMISHEQRSTIQHPPTDPNIYTLKERPMSPLYTSNCPWEEHSDEIHNSSSDLPLRNDNFDDYDSTTSTQHSDNNPTQASTSSTNFVRRQLTNLSSAIINF